MIAKETPNECSMTVYLPTHPDLRTRLPEDTGLLVACYCAAWCDTCSLYRGRFEAMAKQHPEHTFVWIDIEDDPELLGDEDVENFPTILIEKSHRVLFFGVMLPHIQQLERLLQSLIEGPNPPGITTGLNDVRQQLIEY